VQDPEDERGWLGKIADFGLSVKIKRGEKHVSGIQHGTEGYVAPGLSPSLLFLSYHLLADDMTEVSVIYLSHVSVSAFVPAPFVPHILHKDVACSALLDAFVVLRSCLCHRLCTIQYAC
jgi:hypothetical protein